MFEAVRRSTSFGAAMKRLRRDDITMNLTSRGVVVRGLPERGVSSSLPDCRKLVTCLQTINCTFIAFKTTCHVSITCTSFKKSKRDISVYLWITLDGDPCLLPLHYFRIIAMRTILFQYQTSYGTIALPVYHNACTSCILKFG